VAEYFYKIFFFTSYGQTFSGCLQGRIDIVANYALVYCKTLSDIDLPYFNGCQFSFMDFFIFWQSGSHRYV
jgi:hypothetical protein